MEEDKKQKDLLRRLPGVDRIFELAKVETLFEEVPKTVLIKSIRFVIEDLRKLIFDGCREISGRSLSDFLKSDYLIMEKVKKRVENMMRPNLICTINATGVVIHTNLGRSLLSSDAVCNISDISRSYSNLEFDLSKGVRGLRYSCVEDILCELSGAEAAMVVNNNAGAVLLCLDTIAKNKEVIVSRGELVEIGGSFRIPDVMAKSGGILKEVGTTNRTHMKDYIGAINSDTGLLLKVHTSNYSIVGFTADVSLGELVRLGDKYRIPVMEDLGSGTFIDFSKYDLLKEPTVQESVAAGADVITFSGDKLLGGPQAGIIVGKKDIVDKIKINPLTRALRIDKLTLAALESTLSLYRDPETVMDAVPTLRMLTLPLDVIENRAKQLGMMLENLADSRLDIQIVHRSSRAGGGSLPLLEIPSRCMGINIKGVSVNKIERFMRKNLPPIIGRIEGDLFIMDLRTIQDDELPMIEKAFESMLERI